MDKRRENVGIIEAGFFLAEAAQPVTRSAGDPTSGGSNSDVYRLLMEMVEAWTHMTNDYPLVN